MKTIVLCLSLLIACSALAGEKENKEVKKAIQENIKLLEADKIESFLTNIIHPEEAAKRKSLKIDSKFIEHFKRRKKDRMLAIFRKIENQTPDFSSENMVFYRLDEKKRPKFLTFKIYKGKWYLSNKSGNPVKK